MSTPFPPVHLNLGCDHVIITRIYEAVILSNNPEDIQLLLQFPTAVFKEPHMDTIHQHRHQTDVINRDTYRFPVRPIPSFSVPRLFSCIYSLSSSLNTTQILLSQIGYCAVVNGSADQYFWGNVKKSEHWGGRGWSHVECANSTWIVCVRQ